MQAPEQNFIFVTTQVQYQEISNAAIAKGMTVAEYVSLAIYRQINDDKRQDSSQEDVQK